MTLEEMGTFFDARLDGYDQHQLTCIQSAGEFYPFTAKCLPIEDGTQILDLGCGTGLELEYYFALAPEATVTGIDLAPGMLKSLRQKFPEKNLELILGSYFDVAFARSRYDAAVSVESLHHFTLEEKTRLYQKVWEALKPNGYLILTDYFSQSEAEETAHRQMLLQLKAEQSLDDGRFYHYDTPLTVSHETEALLRGGFSSVELLGQWGATSTLKAAK